MVILVVLLPGNRKVVGSVDPSLTWSDFLGREGVQVTPGAYIRTKNNVLRDGSGTRPGWRASLNDQIGDFLSKYKKQFSRHVVKLVGGGNPARVVENRNNDLQVEPRSQLGRLMETLQTLAAGMRNV